KAGRREVAETELVESTAGVDQDVRLGACAAEEVDLVEQRRVLHDQRVGLDDRLMRADPPVGDAAERRHRRARSLRPERGEGERLLAFGAGRDGEQLEGSQAVARAVARCRPEVVSAYPISPQ